MLYRAGDRFFSAFQAQISDELDAYASHLVQGNGIYAEIRYSVCTSGSILKNAMVMGMEVQHVASW